MARKRLAKPFRNGRSHAARPACSDLRLWFAELDRFKAEPFMDGRRKQPATPRRASFATPKLPLDGGLPVWYGIA